MVFEKPRGRGYNVVLMTELLGSNPPMSIHIAAFDRKPNLSWADGFETDKM